MSADLAPVATDAPRWPWVLAGAGVLALPAGLNGQAFLYFDSAAYMTLPGGLSALLGEFGIAPPPAVSEVAQGAEPALEPHRGRALAYRLAGWLSRSSGLGLWPLVAAQALVTAQALSLLWTAGTGRATGWAWLAVLAALTFVTPLGLFVGMAMPDVFVGLLVVSVALLTLSWTRITPGARWFLALLAAWAMVIHTSHVALGAVLLGILALAAVRFAAISRRGLAVLVLGLSGALAVEAAISVAQARLDGRLLLTRPHVTANLVDQGPGTDFLRRACPDAGFVLCDHLDRLPMPWIDFLFSRDPDRGLYAVVDANTRAALAAEHGRFVLAVLADDPVRLAGFALRATLSQLVDLSSADAVVPPEALPDLGRTFPADELGRLRETRLMRTFDIPLATLDMATRVTALGALAVLMAVALSRKRRHRPREAAPTLAIVSVLLLGLLINAAICGVLAGVYGRFQARIIWTLPMAAALVVPLLMPQPRPTPPLPAADGPSSRRLFSRQPSKDAR